MGARFVTFVVAFGLSAHAMAAPCDGPQSPAIKALASQLATGRADTWAQLVVTAAGHTAQGAPAERACAHYVAGAAAFFLSHPPAERAARAWQAVRHLTAAQALAPAAMAERQPQARLASAWSRVEDAPGWTAKAGVAPAVLVTDAPATVQLFSPVAGRAPIELTLAAGRHGLTLRPGPWRLARPHPTCAPAPQAVTLGGAPVTVPPLACPVALSITDRGAPVADVTVTGPQGPVALDAVRSDGGPLTIQAPGYAAVRVALPAAGGALAVAMSRCTVTLGATTVPDGVPVQGLGPGPWGPRALVLWPDGPAPTPVTVEVPRPSLCEGSAHVARIVAPRQVLVSARGGDDQPVPLTRLVVGQRARSPDGFALPPGSYMYQASRAGAPLALGRIDVPPCPSAADCPPHAVTVRWPPEPAAASNRPSGVGPQLTLALGGLVTAGGLVAGLQALSTQQAIDDYTTPAQTRSSLGALIDQRDQQALTADVLLGIGLTTAVTGLVWLLLTD